MFRVSTLNPKKPPPLNEEGQVDFQPRLLWQRSPTSLYQGSSQQKTCALAFGQCLYLWSYFSRRKTPTPQDT